MAGYEVTSPPWLHYPGEAYDPERDSVGAPLTPAGGTGWIGPQYIPGDRDEAISADRVGLNSMPYEGVLDMEADSDGAIYTLGFVVAVPSRVVLLWSPMGGNSYEDGFFNVALRCFTETTFADANKCEFRYSLDRPGELPERVGQAYDLRPGTYFVEAQAPSPLFGPFYSGAFQVFVDATGPVDPGGPEPDFFTNFVGTTETHEG